MTLDTRLTSLSNLRKFFEIGNFNTWFSVPSYLIHPEDFSGTKPHPLPRYIPDEVIQQVNQNLDKLYEPVMRMVIVQQEFGLRVSELLTLKCYCTEQDSKGQWSLKFFRGKTKREDHLPIVNLEIVRVIQEQQAYIQDQFEDRYEYLFCGNQIGSYNQFRPQPKVMSDSCFANYLNRFAKVADIRDSSGKLWHFQTHQFRHTVGTRMINNGVPQHIVQRYLGHASADMTAVYAHIHDKTLRKAAEDFHERVVNVSGNNVNSSNPEIDGNDDLNWIRKQMSAQALPNGYCARPLVKGPCPHANACLTCGDFRTTQEFLEVHRDELQRTEELISMARKNDWQRQVEINEIVAINLRKMIVSLEAS
jgi:integrase